MMITRLLGIAQAAFVISSLALGLQARAAGAADQGTELRYAVTKVAKALLPSVVHIEISQERAKDPTAAQGLFQESAPAEEQETALKFKQEVTALASGIILDDKGYIITNNHVVEGASSIEVTLWSGRRYPARLEGADPKTDIAVIKIEPDTTLSPAVFGDSDRVEIGEWVVAIGNPRGLDLTVTQGIISAKDRRRILDPSSYLSFLQTDAAINPGNSGGPLINLEGKVIGINSVIASESGGFEGIGFAIPGNIALSTARSLIAHGRVKRGWIGASVDDLDEAKARELDLPSPKGVLVIDVIKDGPADKAGIKTGDVITAAAGRELLDAAMFRNIIALFEPETDLPLEILRAGSSESRKVRLVDLESSLRLIASTVKARMGVEARSLKQQEKETFGIETGVAVSWLDPAGPLAKAGFEAGDIILEMDGQMIRNVHDFASIAATILPRQVTILLAIDHRSGESAYVQVKAR
ncbi:MAG TPA: trypsin-like peptidase domain-containing protein [Deltaproteobacteria bacterium]|nr:trypsin-like peptidase domain-containing protein [Deltaproteobacteria bacterium]HOM29180.1 trypsin-like peptidase domain-containing protein [Deltaproteobacteria bacterium]HPP79693.1 trypsin-like peptidase domain-containing protein [Deltaproteobacteria bacterium]